MIELKQNISLAPYTSLDCGGQAEYFAVTESNEDTLQLLDKHRGEKINLFGYGTNSLISDKGLPGLTIFTHGGNVTIEEGLATVDAGVWWDDFVASSITHGLWGVELTSGIPSSVGGAVIGNIAAYGQQVSDCLQSITVFDLQKGQVRKIAANEVSFSYRRSSLQDQPHLAILSSTFQLSQIKTTELTYESALLTAEQLSLDPTDLEDRREIILETRRHAGSLYDPSDKVKSRTAGSFFKNPEVPLELAKKLAGFDETGKTLERILRQNEVHGGSKARASAAHVLLAAGFKRGQNWGPVRLHPDHILKIENTGGARAQQVYDVAQNIIETVQEKLAISLQPEVRFVGDFTSDK